MSLNKHFYRIFLPVALLLLAACSQDSGFDANTIGEAQILNLASPEANVMASGQPTEEQLRLLAESGVKHIINLRAPGEVDWDEAALVESLDMEYYSIPVAGARGVTRDNAESLFSLLDSLEGQPVLVHCASGNRVGALVALSASQHDNLNVEQALAEGERWGLRSDGLKTAVRTVLSAN